MKKDNSAFPVNPLVKDMLAAGGQVIQVEGYVGPSDGERVQFYRDLSLNRYLEIPKADIVRILALPEHPDGRCRLFFKRTAEIRLVKKATLKADEIVAAVAAAGASCGGTETTERVYPPDNCGGRCQMEYITCIRRHGGDLWCAAELTACVLGCIIFGDPPTTAIE